MSPTNAPTPKPGFVPLPEPLPKKEEEKSKKEKSPKERSKPLVKHKPHNSFDTGYGSGYVSPWSVEERSPDQYSPGSQSPRPRPDTVYYETVDGKSRAVKYIMRDGKKVRYVSRTPGSPKEEEYVPGPPALLLEDPYKTKYKAAKETTKVLQQALTKENETAKYNFNAAKQEEAAKLSSAAQIEDLEARLRALHVSQKVLEDRVADADSARKKAEQKLKQRELEKELAERKLELKRSEENLKRKQWDEIEASPSPLQRRRPALPAIVNQEERRPARRNTTTVATSGYGPVTSTVKSPTIIASTNPFMDAIFEAQRDYDESRAQNRGDEDRRRATDVKFSDTRRTTRERERERDRSKRNSFHE